MAPKNERWTHELIRRYGSNVLVIYDDESPIGNINIEDDEIETWLFAIRMLNLTQMQRQKIQDKIGKMLDS